MHIFAFLLLLLIFKITKESNVLKMELARLVLYEINRYLTISLFCIGFHWFFIGFSLLLITINTQQLIAILYVA